MIRKLSEKLENNKIIAFFLDRQLFSVVYIIVCILWFFPVLGTYMNIFSKLCFCWGAALVAYDLLTNRRLFKSYKAFLLVLMVGAYVVTTLLNYQDMLYMGIKHIIYNGIFLFILYAQDCDKNEEVYKKYLKQLNNFIIAIALAASAVSFVLYVMNYSFVLEIGDDAFRQGFLENRLFGIYTSPNTGALMSIISMLLSLMNHYLYEKKTGKLKILYVANALMQIVYYSLTLSRGGSVTFSILALMLVLVLVLPKLKKRFNSVLSVALCVLVMISSVLVIKYIPSLLRTGLSYVPAYVQSLTNPTTDTEKEDKEKIEFTRIESGDDASNGRSDIWKAGLTAWKEAPLFGLADMKVFKDDTFKSKVDVSIFNENNIESLKRANGNMHNAYVQIIVYSGIIGFLLFAAFAVFLVKKYVMTLLKMDKDSQHYKITGIIFALVGALAANGMIESHLLFNQHDPYGAVFWFYLGVGIYFIDKYNKQKSDEDEKFAFICDTPIQVMNAMNFVSNNIRNSKNNSDIFIYHQFKNSYKISNNLKNINYFENVYDVETISTEKHWYTPVLTLKRLMFPDAFIKKNIKPYHKANEYSYKFLVICAYNSFAITMKNKFNKAQVLTLEEGLASYFGNNMKDDNSRLMNLAGELLFNGSLSINSEALYVNNTKLCKSTISENKYELPQIQNPAFISDLKMVFNYVENDIYRQNDLVFLTQPFEDNDKDEYNFYMNIKDTFIKNGYTDKCIVRIHPRQSANLYKEFNIDTIGNLWELESLFQISDDSILIASLSTAQVMPYILAHKQPFLIFMYKMDPVFSGENTRKNLDEFVNNLKSLSTNSEKIYIAENYDDLNSILAEILNA